MVCRELFEWSLSHIESLTSVSEVSEFLELSSPYLDLGAETFASQPIEVEQKMEEAEEIESQPAIVLFSSFFAYTDRLDWFLMIIDSLAILVIYLYYFTKVL